MSAQECINEYIESRLEELVLIHKKYPRNVPVNVVATYLGLAPDTVMASLKSGTSPIGYAWREPGNKNNSRYISTLPFVLRELGKLADWGKLEVTTREFEKLKAVGL